MNCRNTQRLLHDLADERLSNRLSSDVRQHLTECTDCRVAEQRAERLARLIALKRHEQPPPGYFDGVVADFHARLKAAEKEHQQRWEWLLRWISHPVTLEPPRAWRFGWAGAIAIALAMGILGTEVQRSTVTAPAVATLATAPAETAPVLAEVSRPSSIAIPFAVAASAPVRSATRPPPSGVLMVPAVHVQAESPRYVLDRVVITPASYEGSDARF